MKSLYDQLFLCMTLCSDYVLLNKLSFHIPPLLITLILASTKKSKLLQKSRVFL